MATFADRLNFLRKERGWTKAEMYRCMEIAPITLTGYLSGKNSPNIDAVRGYAEKLGVSLSWLAGEEEDKNSSLLVPGESTYADLIAIVNNVLGVAGFYVDIDVADNEPSIKNWNSFVSDFIPEDMTRVMLKSDDAILVNYYKTYISMQNMLSDGRISEQEFTDFVEMKRLQLSDRIICNESKKDSI